MSMHVRAAATGLRHTVAGFVLVELMLVVGIIGVLAAVALPAYQDYTMRTRVAEALDLASVAQKAVVDFHDRWGVMPINNAQAGLPAPQVLQGRYVSGIEVLPAGVLLIGMRMPSPDKQPGDQHLVLRPAMAPGNLSAPVVWVCQLGDVPEGAQVAPMPAQAQRLVASRMLPSICRGR